MGDEAPAMLRTEGACQTGSAALLHPRPDSPPCHVLLYMSAMQINSQTLPEWLHNAAVLITVIKARGLGEKKRD